MSIYLCDKFRKLQIMTNNDSLSLNIFMLTCTRKLKSVAIISVILPAVSAKGKSGRRSLTFSVSYVDS